MSLLINNYSIDVWVNFIIYLSHFNIYSLTLTLSQLKQVIQQDFLEYIPLLELIIRSHL